MSRPESVTKSNYPSVTQSFKMSRHYRAPGANNLPQLLVLEVGNPPMRLSSKIPLWILLIWRAPIPLLLSTRCWSVMALASVAFLRGGAAGAGAGAGGALRARATPRQIERDAPAAAAPARPAPAAGLQSFGGQRIIQQAHSFAAKQSSKISPRSTAAAAPARSPLPPKRARSCRAGPWFGLRKCAGPRAARGWRQGSVW